MAVLPPIHVIVTREPWSDFFLLTLDNGMSEELEPDPTRQWFKLRGANMDNVEKMLDHVWNFQYAEFVISNPREINYHEDSLTPNV